MDDQPIPESEWVWCGYAGHFVGQFDCRLRMHTRVGNFRVSTVGDYHPGGQREREPIGARRYFETFVFPVEGHGDHGEGVVVDWTEQDSRAWETEHDAERGHIEVCRQYAGLVPAP